MTPAPVIIPDDLKYLLTQPICAVFTTLMEDGSPQSTVVWRLWEAPYILISSLKNSRKAQNIAKDPRVNIMMFESHKPYTYLEIRGVVEEIMPDPDAAMIDRISTYYIDKPYYGGAEPLEDKGTVEHVTFKIKPVRVISH